MILFASKIISNFYVKDNSSVINYLLLNENNSLKKEIKELSNIDYHNYDYVLGKITIKNLYQSNAYFIETSSEVQNNLPVINNIGLIGLYSNSYLVPTSSLNLSVWSFWTDGIFVLSYSRFMHLRQICSCISSVNFSL